MSTILPFRAFRYHLPKAEIGKAVCPPYDIIGETLEKKLKTNSKNAIQIELPAGSTETKYAHAKKVWDSWTQKEVVKRDSAPTFYIYEQIFNTAGKKYSRKGFFCEVELEKPGEGSILRHELTISGPKIDRLNLIRSLNINTSPVFGLFKDNQKKVSKILERFSKQKPEIQFKDWGQVIHKMWICNDPKNIHAIQAVVKKSPIAIADGHHRYETAWNYLQESKKNGAKSTLFFICPMDSSGLVIFPTHRILRKELQSNFTSIDHFLGNIGKKSELFKIRSVSSPCIPKLSSFIVTDGKKSFEISLKSLTGIKKLLPGKPKEYLKLSLIHIHSILFPEMKKEDFIYSHDLAETMNLVCKNKTIAILVPPTFTKELYGIVQAGELMPQKSTYFYPKIITGMVFRSLT